MVKLVLCCDFLAAVKLTRRGNHGVSLLLHSVSTVRRVFDVFRSSSRKGKKRLNETMDDTDSKSTRTEDPVDENQWEAKDRSLLLEDFAMMKVEDLEKTFSRTEVAGIVVRQAHHLVATADVFPPLASAATSIRTLRTTTLKPSVSSEAASTIARFVRRYRPFYTHQLAQNFFEHGPTIERVKSIRSYYVCFTSNLRIQHNFW